MMTNIDFQKPFQSMQSLMNVQVAAVTKSVEQQKKTGEALASFFQAGFETAKDLKTPEAVIKFNVDTNKALFELLKAEGEVYTAIAVEAREAATAELSKLVK